MDKKERICIILGTAHLDSTPGKCSPDNRIREAYYSRDRIAGIAAKLRAYGYHVETDYESLYPKPEWTAARKKSGYSAELNLELKHRVNVVNSLCKKYGTANCLYVSVHVNAAGAGQWMLAGGWSGITSVGQTKGDKLADCLYWAAENNLHLYKGIFDTAKAEGKYSSKQKYIRTDNTDGDPDIEQNLYVLKSTNCAACLTENLFQDNKTDVEFLLSEEGQHAIERIHVEGILRYIEKYM